ncbi:MAG: hypothetical protein RIC03_06905 [Cyclobacteriaceae bacterium]
MDTDQAPHKSYLYTDRRNDKVAARFYYYGSLHRMSYEATLECLEKEFDISHSTLINIMKEKLHLLKQYEADKESLKNLSRKYPFYNWQVARHIMLG